jgi:hypothetical protein
MDAISLETLFELLGTTDLPGNDRERALLCSRIGELLELNGADWVRENRGMLLEQWQCVLGMKTVR